MAAVFCIHILLIPTVKRNHNYNVDPVNSQNKEKKIIMYSRSSKETSCSRNMTASRSTNFIILRTIHEPKFFFLNGMHNLNFWGFNFLKFCTYF